MAYTACSLILPCALGNAPLEPACLRLGLSCCFFLFHLFILPLHCKCSQACLCPKAEGFFGLVLLMAIFDSLTQLGRSIYTSLVSPYKHYLDAMLSQELKGLFGASLPPVMPEHKAFSLMWAKHSTPDLQLYPNHPCLRPKLEQCHSNSSCCLVTQKNRWNNCRSGL